MKNYRWLVVILLLVALAVTSCTAPVTTAPAATAAPAATTAPAAAKTPFKVALLYSGPLTGQPWNLRAHEGLERVKAMGIETAWTEQLDAPQMEGAVRDYAAQGYNLIIGHTFGFSDAAAAAAKDYPNTWFIVNAGTASSTNLAGTAFQEQQNHYLAGVLAALMTKSGVIGFIGGFDYPSLFIELNGYKDGAEATRPGTKVLVSWVGSWGDPAKTQELAQAMIEKGADIILEQAGGGAPGAWKACSNADIWCIKAVSTCMEDIPDNCLASVDMTFEELIPLEVNMAMSGQLEGKVYPWGIKEKVLDLGPINAKVPQDVVDKVMQARDDIISGKLVIPANYEWSEK